MNGELKNKFSDVLSTIDEIKKFALDLSDGQLVVFSPNSLKHPYLQIPIHGFYTSVSWFYVLYFETGKTTLEFLSERADGLGLDSGRIIKKHKGLIESFRTFLQHNLNVEKSGDITKKRRCYDWISECLEYSDSFTGNIWPEAEQQWETLTDNLLSEALTCLQIMHKTLILIANDEAREDSIKLWVSREKRYHAPYEYDEIIELAASDLGYKHIDSVIVRNKYYPQWNKKMSVMRGDCDFYQQARLIVEQTLLSEEDLPVPISGREIMEVFGIPAGPEVKILKLRAQQLYNEMPRSKQEIMALLREEISGKLGKTDDLTT